MENKSFFICLAISMIGLFLIALLAFSYQDAQIDQSAPHMATIESTEEELIDSSEWYEDFATEPGHPSDSI